MNARKMPDMQDDMECQCITEDSKTRVYLSVVREFNEEEYEEFYKQKRKENIKKIMDIIVVVAKLTIPTLTSIFFYNGITQRMILERGDIELGSELIATLLIWIWMFLVMDFIFERK